MHLGVGVAPAGDFDGDTLNDLLVASIEVTETVFSLAHLIYMDLSFVDYPTNTSMYVPGHANRTMLNFPSTFTLRRIHWVDYNTDIEVSNVMGAIDINGDGASDIFIGDPMYSYASSGEGAVHMLWGSPGTRYVAAEYFVIAE
jgi:hypothetical protein